MLRSAGIQNINQKLTSGCVKDDFEYGAFVLIGQVDQDSRLSVKVFEVSSHAFSF